MESQDAICVFVHHLKELLPHCFAKLNIQNSVSNESASAKRLTTKYEERTEQHSKAKEAKLSRALLCCSAALLLGRLRFHEVHPPVDAGDLRSGRPGSDRL